MCPEQLVYHGLILCRIQQRRKSQADLSILHQEFDHNQSRILAFWPTIFELSLGKVAIAHLSLQHGPVPRFWTDPTFNQHFGDIGLLQMDHETQLFGSQYAQFL